MSFLASAITNVQFVVALFNLRKRSSLFCVKFGSKDAFNFNFVRPIL